MRKNSKYQLADSDRSGFTYKKITLVKDKGALVAPDEFDMPPPSNKPTGGEGVQINPDARINYDTYTATNSRTTQVVTPAGGITFIQLPDSQDKFDTNNQWIYISGASSLTDITANPQISAGYQNAIFTIQCASNSIIIDNGNGISSNGPYTMTSGDILNLIYNSTDNLWHEISRSSVK